MIWDSDRPTLDYIKDLVKCIGTTLKLKDVSLLRDEGIRVHGE